MTLEYALSKRCCPSADLLHVRLLAQETSASQPWWTHGARVGRGAAFDLWVTAKSPKLAGATMHVSLRWGTAHLLDTQWPILIALATRQSRAGCNWHAIRQCLDPAHPDDAPCKHTLQSGIHTLATWPDTACMCACCRSAILSEEEATTSSSTSRADSALAGLYLATLQVIDRSQNTDLWCLLLTAHSCPVSHDSCLV